MMFPLSWTFIYFFSPVYHFVCTTIFWMDDIPFFWVSCLPACHAFDMIFLLFLVERVATFCAFIYLFIFSPCIHSIAKMNKLTDEKDIYNRKTRRKKENYKKHFTRIKKDNLMTFFFVSSFLLRLIYYRNHYSWLTLFSRYVCVCMCVVYIRVTILGYGNQNLIKSNKIFVAWIFFPWTVYRETLL